MGHFSFFNLISAIFGVAVAAVLLMSSVKNKFPNKLLGIGFLILAFRSLSIFTIQEDLIYNTFLMGSVSCWYYFIPPILYLYIKKTIHDEDRFQKGDLWHFVIPALAVLLLIYYLFANYSVTGQLSLPIQHSKFNDIYPFAIYIQIALHAKIIVLGSVVYTIMAWYQVIKYLKRSKGEHPQMGKMRNWIWGLLGFCTILCIVLFFTAILNWTLNYQIPKMDIGNLNIIRSLVLIVLFTRVLIKRELLLGIPTLSTTLPDIESAESVSYLIKDAQPGAIAQSTLPTNANISEEPEPGELYFDSNGWIQQLEKNPDDRAIQLEPDKINSYIELINAYIEQEPYTNPDFDLKSISTQLNIPYYHLEFLFRYYNQYNFAEFRNVLRVRHVLKAFDNGERATQSLEVLGQKRVSAHAPASLECLNR